MTTPPNEPERPRSADLNEPKPAIPVAPHRGGGMSVKVVVAMAVFALALGGLNFWLSTKNTMKFGDGSAPTSAALTTAPTTTSKPAPFAEPGDCVSMTGSPIEPDFKKVPCGEHNYTVTKVVTSPPPEEKCGADNDGYVQYSRNSVLEQSVSVCLAPVFTDGACYNLAYSTVQASIPRKECGSFGSVRVKVLAETVDKAACGPDPVLALAFPETRTTYCFSA